MKRLITFFFLLSGVVEGVAQQDPLYSQYINNPFVINPAYAGLTDNLNFSVSYRNQWGGYEGSPKTLNANGHVSVFNNKMGIGLMMVADQIGSNKTNEVMAAYSYRVSVTDGKLFSFGLQAGITNFQIDNSKVNPYDATDQLFQGKASETKPTIGFGMILKSDRFFYWNIRSSSPQGNCKRWRPTSFSIYAAFLYDGFLSLLFIRQNQVQTVGIAENGQRCSRFCRHQCITDNV